MATGRTAARRAPFPRPIAPERVRVVFSGLVLAMLLAALDSTIVATALPTIVGELGGLAHISWVVTAYLLAQTVATPLYGKLGDLYGRKGVMQAAVVIFLAGSALSGLSRSMIELIVFRGLQGLGGGGLIVTTQAVVGDLVPPRERGRYMGIFGAVLGVASVAGPLIGGYLTSNLTWRWIFYVNIPIGAVALAVLTATLPAERRRGRRAIDLPGAALLAVVLGGIILICDLAGTVYPWNSNLIGGLAATVVVALALFVEAERRAAEPVLPLRLFKNRTFVVGCAVGLVVGFALFGSVTYMPIFLQIVKGGSPTASGLEMVPMMAGVLVASIASGQLISRWGRYRIFPIAGAGVTAVGLFLLSRLGPETSIFSASMRMLVVGLGLGMTMQVLVIAVQNAVDYADLGVATSGATLFRLIGGSVGTAVMGAIFAGRLTANLTRFLPPGTRIESLLAAGVGPETLAELPPALRAAYAEACTAALHTMFLVAAAVGLAGFALAWLLPERPLKATLAASAEDAGDSAGRTFAPPAHGDPLAQVLGGMIALAGRDVERRSIAAIVARAGVDLSPAAAWLLVRLEADPALDMVNLSRACRVEPGGLQAALEEIAARGLVVEGAAADGKRRRKITAAGCAVFNRLVAARREHLAEIGSEWSPEKRGPLAATLRRVARRLVPETREVR